MLKIGILGAANIAPGALIKPAHRTGKAEIVVVAARDADKARKFADKHKIKRVADSYEEVLADPELDAVYIPLPNGLHGRWTIAALEAGKHVLCEKPFTANADEARHVAEAAAAHPGLVVMEAFHYQYHPMTRRLVEIVQSGEIGIIKGIDISFSAPMARPGDIRYQLDLAGGAMMDMGCYPISLLRLLAAGPRVTGASAKLSSPGVDRAMDARFSLPEGGTARVRCSMFSVSILRLHAEVIGSEGTLKVFNPFAPQFGHRVRVETSSGTRREKFSRRATYDYQLDAFVAAVEDGAPYPTTAVDAIRTMELIDATYVAAGLPIRQPTTASGGPPSASPSEAANPANPDDATQPNDPTQPDDPKQPGDAAQPNDDVTPE
jgi:predicted dehydrogenase